MNNTQSSTSVFADYSRYYDLLYGDKDYQSETDYVDRLIRRFNPKAQSILELGSGTGIHASLLAEKGFTVHGVERSAEMLARSLALTEKNMSSAHDRLAFSQGDIRHIRLSRRFDVGISLFHVISYQTTNDDVSAAFQTAREHLSPGGIFIFDVWYGPAVLTDRPAVRIKRIAAEHIEVTRLAEPVLHLKENLVDVNYHVFVRDLQSRMVKELRETHVMRYFFHPEVELFAAQNGFRLLSAEEWLSGKAPGEDTWGVCFCLKAD
jgi:SAM-dependent methyltransferase